MQDLGYGLPRTPLLVLRSSKTVYINAWPNRRTGKERNRAEAPTRPRTPGCRGRADDPQTGPKPPCSRRLDRKSARIVFLSWEGLRTAKIAEKLGCHPQTVRRRLHRFNTEGIDGLGDRPGGGRKATITEQERSKIIALVSKEPPGRLVTGPDGVMHAEDEAKAAYWTLDTLAEAAREMGIQVSRSQVRRILLSEGVRWRNIRPWAQTSDSEFVPKDRK
jgi:transposase